ncbi:hypothetical protein F503_03802 [Ophiostoma piceae UAMH 11346]|uniref:Uncharacterized protein n=1 Tax=Ophiostoma piceae (strain UAMH 11346) TaxID=1262450 RepID=S3BXF5_OPHP1|nr:hypothetical protein F503_03802 [Ophiostoma piceae UAMH 11346]
MTCEDQCRGAISLLPVYFNIVSGQVRTESDDPLHSILSHIFHQLSTVDDTGYLDVLASPAGESALIKAVYDEDTLPLVEAAAADLPLDPQHKARLLVEGITGAIAVVSKLTESKVITDKCFEDALNSFASSEHRQRIRDAVEHAHLFSECLMPSQILDLVMRLAHVDALPRTTKGPSFDDYSQDMFCSEHERSVAHSMGLPWGLSFMVLN